MPGWRPEPRVVGSASAEKKKELQEDVLLKFSENHLSQFSDKQLEALEGGEREKTAAEKEAIVLANEITNQIREKFELPPFQIPEQNIHIVSDEAYRIFSPERGFAGSTDLAITAYEKQGIFLSEKLREEEHPERILSAILHEVIHLKGVLSFELGEDGSKRILRAGMDVMATGRKAREKGGAIHFRGLHEGIVSELQAIYFREFLEANKEIRGIFDMAFSESAAAERSRVAKRLGAEPRDLPWAYGDHYESIPYIPQRVVLRYLVRTLTEAGAFSSEEESMDAFLDAHFSGRLLSIGRAVTKTFGRDAFRVLGMMGVDQDNNSVRQIIDYLTKQRRIVMGRTKNPHGQEGEVG
ncbi:MAG: hypothetical protein AAB495_04475 [Patescibacteria group bacterium]